MTLSICTALVGNTLQEQETAANNELRILFERFDANGDGLLDEREFGELLNELGWDSPAEVRSLEFAAIDNNLDGLVEFDEFSDWWHDQN
jgi:Ca2+-binding EF-hand superfamily protein